MSYYSLFKFLYITNRRYRNMKRSLKNFIVLLISIMSAFSCNAVVSEQLKSLVADCSEAVQGQLYFGESSSLGLNNLETIEVIIPSNLGCFSVFSKINPILNDSRNGYLWRQPWTFAKDEAFMSVYQVERDRNKGLFVFYFSSNNTLCFCECDYKDMGYANLMHSPDYPTLSDPLIYQRICSATFSTSGFLLNQEIKDSNKNGDYIIIVDIQLPNETNLETLIEQFKGLHLSLLFNQYRLGSNWSKMSNGVWNCYYLLNPGNNQVGDYLTPLIGLFYNPNTNLLILTFNREKKN